MLASLLQYVQMIINDLVLAKPIHLLWADFLLKITSSIVFFLPVKVSHCEASTVKLLCFVQECIQPWTAED